MDAQRVVEPGPLCRSFASMLMVKFVHDSYIVETITILESAHAMAGMVPAIDSTRLLLSLCFLSKSLYICLEGEVKLYKDSEVRIYKLTTSHRCENINTAC